MARYIYVYIYCKCKSFTEFFSNASFTSVVLKIILKKDYKWEQCAMLFSHNNVKTDRQTDRQNYLYIDYIILYRHTHTHHT